MFKKKLLLIALIVLIAGISCVNATNTTDNNIMAENDAINVDLEMENDILSETHSISGNTFEEIEDAINSASSGDTIELSGNYIGSGKEIRITKAITIDGKNTTTLDAKHNSRIFYIDTSGVILKNMILTNGYIGKDDDNNKGGAIFSQAGNSYYKGDSVDKYNYNVENCFLINNNAYDEGGAMYGGNAINCTFIGNSVSSYGGGAFSGNMAINCSFINNTCNGWAGATNRVKAYNCIYINNTAGWGGGAMHHGLAQNCTFINNHVSDGDGGAIRDCDEVVNCTFISNSATIGGAMMYGGAVNSIFINNHAKSSGGATYSYNGEFKNCILINNTAGEYGGGSYSANSKISYKNCSYINNSAGKLGGAIYNGTAENCSFEGDSIPVTYAAKVTNSNLITEQKLSLKLTQSGSYYKEKKLKATLQFENTNIVLPNEKIKLEFSNGKTAEITTDDKGEGIYNIDFNPGTYSVKAKLSASQYESNQATLKNIKIVKTPAEIKAAKLTAAYDSGKNFQVKLVNSKTKNPLGNVKITLKVYTGKKAKTVSLKTNSEGIAKYSASKLSIGTHKVIVNVKDTKNINSKSKSSTIKIKKAQYSISAPEVTNNYKITGTFKVTVKNKASGKVLSNVKVTVSVYTGKKVKTFNVKTDKNGEASISTKSMTKGTHKVVVNLKDTSKYKGKSEKSSIKIVKGKIKTEFVFNGMYYNYYANGALKSVTINLDLIDQNGNKLQKAITGQIYREFLGKSETYGSLAKGTSGKSLEVFKNIGSWTFYVQVDFDGDSEYESSRFIRYI